jgi:NADH-quinone oxidoreductase subunit H
MISYELPLALAIVAPILIANTLSFKELAEAQSGFHFGFLPKWHIFAAPFPQIFSFLIFLVAAFAETNRVPFDLPEAETELVAGFHTEYTSTMFAAFFTAEYANIVTICCVTTLLFLGGWHPLFPSAYGSDYIPVILLLGVAGMFFFHAGQTIKTRRWDRFSFPVGGVLSLGLAGLFLIPMLLVRGQDAVADLRLHLGAWNAAAFSLRPVNAVCVDVPVPRGRCEPVDHRLCGGADLEITVL